MASAALGYSRRDGHAGICLWRGCIHNLGGGLADGAACHPAADCPVCQSSKGASVLAGEHLRPWASQYAVHIASH